MIVQCTFTLGAVWGAVEAATGKRLQATHTGSVLRGGNSDVFEFSPMHKYRNLDQEINHFVVQGISVSTEIPCLLVV